ncbi:MAG: hypothetical protein ACI8R4_000187 [Paracoccaceae bacterium]
MRVGGKRVKHRKAGAPDRVVVSEPRNSAIGGLGLPWSLQITVNQQGKPVLDLLLPAAAIETIGATGSILLIGPKPTENSGAIAKSRLISSNTGRF